jgi:hypothetical protein
VHRLGTFNIGGGRKINVFAGDIVPRPTRYRLFRCRMPH